MKSIKNTNSIELRSYDMIKITKFKALLNYLQDTIIMGIDNGLNDKQWLNYYIQLQKLVRLSNLESNRVRVLNGFYLIELNYFRLNSTDYSKIFSDWLGLQKLPSDFRFFLTDDIYLDVYLSNAHPTILYDFSLKNDFEMPYLQKLVLNWKKFYENVNSNLKQAKTETLKVLNQIKISNENQNNVLLRGLHLEIMSIRNLLWKKKSTDVLLQNEKIFNDKKTENQKKWKLQSLYCNKIKSDLLMELYKHFVSKIQIAKSVDPITSQEYENLSFVPTFDGAMVKFLDENQRPINDIVNHFNESLPEYFKFKVKKLEKDNDSIFDFTLLDKYHIIEEYMTQFANWTQIQTIIKSKNIKLEISQEEMNLFRDLLRKRNELLFFDDLHFIKKKLMLYHLNIWKIFLPHALSISRLKNFIDSYDNKK